MCIHLIHIKKFAPKIVILYSSSCTQYENMGIDMIAYGHCLKCGVFFWLKENPKRHLHLLYSLR